jgi:hypothetical protein
LCSYRLGWLASYYLSNSQSPDSDLASGPSPRFQTFVVSRKERIIYLQTAADLPSQLGTTTSFAVRWTGSFIVPTTGYYTFLMTTDDGGALFLNGQPILISWIQQAATTYQTSQLLTVGASVNITFEYYQYLGGFEVVRWSLIFCIDVFADVAMDGP